MGKEAKTNAMRMLDRKKVKYEVIAYDCGEFIDGIHCADITGAPHDQSFKTLVMEGKSGGYYVFVVPIEKEVDRKAAAKSVGEKTVDMIKDHGLYPRRLQPSWNEKKLSGGV
jgi:Cys-tRNA(Pro)/Cys-tRNA(Cys) deacylase